MTAAAVVNPVTELDRKFAKDPNCSSPMTIWARPTNNASTCASCTRSPSSLMAATVRMEPIVENVRMESSAVVPIAVTTPLPNSAYTISGTALP